MAKESKTRYPMLALKNWWVIRKKFIETMPKGAVTESYLAPILGMTVVSARANVIPELRLIGLIDDEGKPTELANRWRDEKEYPKVCEEIKQKVYPRELLDAVPDPTTARKSAESWFKIKKKVGEPAAKRMTTFYILVSEADPKGGEALFKPPPKEKKAKPQKKEKTEEVTPEMPREEVPLAPQFPSIHIDLQIHISPEAKPEQVDKIFESIAKHFKEFYPPHKSK